MSRRTDAPARSPRRAALASWIGSALEYYDFAVYGTAAAIVLNRIFFPEDTAAIGILKSMVVVGVAYVVRPFGAMIVGPLGDRYGRRFVLMLTLPDGLCHLRNRLPADLQRGGYPRPHPAGHLPHDSGPLRRR